MVLSRPIGRRQVDSLEGIHALLAPVRGETLRGGPMIDARIENGQVDLYDASSGMYKRTIRPGSSPASVEADRDEVSITFENGSVDVYSTQGLYKRTIGQAPPTS
jgi:hypothetical protein